MKNYERKGQGDVLEAFRQRFWPDISAGPRFQESSDIIHFVHVPKTAGMSVGRALRSVFDHFHGVQWDNIDGSFDLAARKACYQRSVEGGRHVIMGHYSYRQLARWKASGLPVKAAAILRDPVERTLSHYRYNSSESHPPHRAFRDRFPTLEDFVEDLAPDEQLYQLVGPSLSFEHALEKLISDYTFIGVTEHLAQSMNYFTVSHGLKGAKEYHENVGDKQASYEEIDDRIIGLIRAKSVNDIKVHSLICEDYGYAGSAV